MLGGPDGDLALLGGALDPACDSRVTGERLVPLFEQARTNLVLGHAQRAVVSRLPVLVLLHVFPSDDDALLRCEQRGAVRLHRRPLRRLRRLLKGPVVVEPELRPAVVRAGPGGEALEDNVILDVAPQPWE